MIRHNAFVLAFAWGFLIWALAPLLVGTREPWDAAWPYYTLAMAAGGLVGGWLLPGRWLAAPLGLWLGQALAVAVLPGGDLAWLPLGIVTTAIGALIGFIPYLVGWAGRRLWQRRAAL